MLKHGLLAAVVAIALSTPAMADVPVLSGNYVVNAVENCVAFNGTFHQVSGIINFDPDSGKAKQDAYLAGGDPLTLQHIQGTGTYSNSKNTLTLDTETFQATYGKLSKGIATYVSYIGLVNSDHCATQGWLLRK